MCIFEIPDLYRSHRKPTFGEVVSTQGTLPDQSIQREQTTTGGEEVAFVPCTQVHM